VHKTQLLTCAEVKEVGQDSSSLGARAILEVLSNLGQEEVFVVGGIAPIGLEI
jgi:hypothetical protein